MERAKTYAKITNLTRELLANNNRLTALAKDNKRQLWELRALMHQYSEEATREGWVFNSDFQEWLDRYKLTIARLPESKSHITLYIADTDV